MDNHNIKLIEINGKSYKVIIDPVGEEINTQDLSKIDYSNIIGELLICGTIFNQYANLKAEVDEQVKIKKMELEIFEAQLEEKYKGELASQGIKSTINAVDSLVIQNKDLIEKKLTFFKLEKHQQYFDNIYWGLNKKETRLLKMSERLKPEEFNIDILTQSYKNITLKQVRV